MTLHAPGWGGVNNHVKSISIVIKAFLLKIHMCNGTSNIGQVIYYQNSNTIYSNRCPDVLLHVYSWILHCVNLLLSCKSTHQHLTLECINSSTSALCQFCMQQVSTDNFTVHSSTISFKFLAYSRFMMANILITTLQVSSAPFPAIR